MPLLSDATLAAFVRAWNEPDGNARLALLESAYSEDGEFKDGHSKAVGRAELSALIDETLERAPGRRLELEGWILRLGGPSGFRWRLDIPGQPSIDGRAVTEVDGAGLLKRVVSFNEPGAEAKQAVRSERLRAWMLGNALALASLFVLVIYLVLRFQAQNFYDGFGVSPEDAGFGSVELVVRQATDVLAAFVKVGLLWSIGYLVGMVPWMYVTSVHRTVRENRSKAVFWIALPLSILAAALVELGLTWEWWLAIPGVALFVALIVTPRWLYPGSEDVRSRVLRPLLGWAAFAMVFGTLGFGFFVFAVTGFEQAERDADLVQAGGWVDGGEYPWQARPVAVQWLEGREPFDLPNCEPVAYLGQANGWALIYDARGDGRMLRLPLTDIRLLFTEPDRCALSSLPGRAAR